MQSTFIRAIMRFQKTFLFAVGIWCIGGMLGWWFQPTVSEIQQENLKAWNTMPREFDAQQIILNNLLVITISLAGLLTAGSTAVLTLLINGFIAILFLKDISILELPWVVKCRLFYVVFEVFALWISSAVGLLGLPQVLNVFRISRFRFSAKDLVSILIVYLISITFTVIAGILEAELITILTAGK